MPLELHWKQVENKLKTNWKQIENNARFTMVSF